MKLRFEKVGELVFLVSECGTLFRTWRADEFTERKKRNAMARVRKDAPRGTAVEFVD